MESQQNWKRTRQFFRTEAEAVRTLAGLKRQRLELGAAWDVLPARRKAQVMGIMADMEKAGTTLEAVWQGWQARPVASGCTLGQAVKEVLQSKQDANCRPRHLANPEWYLGKFIAGREASDVSTIGEPELVGWFTERKETPVAKKGHMALLSILFGHCVRRGHIRKIRFTLPRCNVRQVDYAV